MHPEKPAWVVRGTSVLIASWLGILGSTSCHVLQCVIECRSRTKRFPPKRADSLTSVNWEREMTAAFSTTWHTFRRGLDALPPRQAAFSMLHRVLGVPEQRFGHARSRHALSQGDRCCLKQWQFTHFRPLILHVFIKQSRWVSFWRPPPEEKIPGEMTAENELSISAEDIEKVFGRKLDSKQGLEILLTLQKHRSDGTLDHKLPFSNTLATKGLAYLRKVNPIDEDAAIIARIDRETDTTPQTNAKRSPHAVSQFEKLKRDNEERRQVQEAQREAVEQKKLEEGARATSKQVKVKENKTTAPSNDLVGLRPEPEWVRNYRAKATNLDTQKTLLSAWARLLPSALVTVIVVGLAVVFAQNYTPPSRKARVWPDTPPAAATVITLVGVNCLVFLMWRIPPLWRSMNRNFLVAPVYPYSMSMLGAPFSHQQFSHLFANVAFLWLVGTRGRCHAG